MAPTHGKKQLSCGLRVKFRLLLGPAGLPVGLCINQVSTLVKRENRDFRGSPVVKTCASTVGGPGLIPDQETKIPHAVARPKNKKIKKKKGKIIESVGPA